MTMAVPGRPRWTTPSVLICAATAALTAVDLCPGAAVREESTNMTLSVEWSASSVYVGEPVALRFAWDCLHPLETIKAVDIRIPVLRNKAFREMPPPPASSAPAPGTIGIPVNDTRVIGVREGNCIRFEKTVVPLVVGTHEIPPASLSCAVVAQRSRAGFQYPSYFDNQFFESDGNVKHRREFVRTDSARLTVRPLPDAGRPPDFSGLVGACSIAATASPLAVQVGDPVTLELSISGHPHPEIVPMPDISSEPAFLADFEFSGDAAVPVTRDGARVFRYTIRPRHASVTEIPSVMLSFFNTDSQSYRTATSEPVAIEVRDAEIADAYDGVLNDGTRLKNTIRPIPDGIMHDHADVMTLTARASVWGISLSRSLMLLLLPPFIYVLLRVTTADIRLARRDPAAARARRAYRTYRRRMAALAPLGDRSSPEALAACDRALREYLAARFDLTAGALTYNDVAERLEADGLSAEDRKVVQDTLLAHNAMLYADPAPPLPDRAPAPHVLSKTVSRLERLLPLLLLLLAPASALPGEAGSPPDRMSAAELVARANEHMQAAHESAGDRERSQALYETAAATYRHVLDRGIRNGYLYYNLGNACYWAGDRGRALLNYRRAECYLPGNADVLHNIAVVRSESRDAVPPSVLSRIKQYFLFRDALLNRRTRVGLIAFAWIAVWVLLGIGLFREDRRFARALRVLAISAAALLISLLVDAAIVSRVKTGVIVDRQVVARKGSALVYQPAFSTPLHAGTECHIVSVRGTWTRIRLRNGLRCWIPSQSVGVVR
jgi:tetratricopeptide (TPR) repeat protein